MTPILATIIAISVFFGILLVGAVVTVIKDIVKTRKLAKETGEKQGSWWKRHKPSKRRLIQVYAALLFNANLKGLISGKIYTGNTKYMCVPGLNCYSCPGAVGACPLGALQNALAQSGATAPYYILGILALFGLLLGRTICGFLCPVGLGQELLYKIKTPKLQKSRFTRIFSYFKYVILIVFVVALPLIFGLMDPANGGPVPAFCKFICPAGTFGGAILLLANPKNASLYEMLGPLFTWKFCVLVVLIVASIFIYRCFCRFFCPLGAIYGFFNKIALLGIKLDKGKCTDCGLCVEHCKMDIKYVGDHECINCGECIDVCPAKAITWKGSKFFLHQNAIEGTAPTVEKPLSVENTGILTASAPMIDAESASPVGAAEPVLKVTEPALETSVPVEPPAGQPKKRRGKAFWLQVAAWTLALAVLLTALVYYNFIDRDPTPPTPSQGTDVNTGTETGDLAPNFTLDEYYSDTDFDLYATRGKIVVLNFWGTWCTPCVQEIPHFEEVAESYSENVTVVFVHSIDIEEDVEAFINGKGWSHEYARFVQDNVTQQMYTTFGGSGVWPMTVILDKEGNIAAKQQGPMDKKTLERDINLLLAQEE